jgi:hypothetical protein
VRYFRRPAFRSLHRPARLHRLRTSEPSYTAHTILGQFFSDWSLRRGSRQGRETRIPGVAFQVLSLRRRKLVGKRQRCFANLRSSPGAFRWAAINFRATAFARRYAILWRRDYHTHAVVGSLLVDLRPSASDFAIGPLNTVCPRIKRHELVLGDRQISPPTQSVIAGFWRKAATAFFSQSLAKSPRIVIT